MALETDLRKNAAHPDMSKDGPCASFRDPAYGTISLGHTNSLRDPHRTGTSLVSETGPQREILFRNIYETHYRENLAYALRRCSDAATADDAVAETFMVLWRRLEHAPTGDATVLWLYGVARRVIHNQGRSRLRRERLITRLRAVHLDSIDGESAAVARFEADAVISALKRLNDDDQEVILLAAWEGLGNRQIATVLGCSENAVAIRLHRARKRLAAIVGKENLAGGDIQAERLQNGRCGIRKELA